MARIIAWLLAVASASQPVTAQVAATDSARRLNWDVTQPRGQTREIDFTTDQGTWTSLDISPDGRWIVFDLLGHIYRVPATGGQAESLTQNSGIALNFHPKYSPDGRSIAFVSDRRGQNNLWTMNADGSGQRAVFNDENVRVVEPEWTPDSRYIIVRRQHMTDRAGGGIWMYHRDGGEGVALVTGEPLGAEWPSLSADGRYLYFHHRAAQETVSGRNDVVQGSRQLSRLERQTGQITEVTSGVSLSQYQGSSGGAVAPEVSPDGRWLAFARRIPTGTVVIKGHEFGPRTALWLRDLRSGAERVIMDPIEVDMAEAGKVLRVLPGYAWSPDGKSILISQGGRIRRLDVARGTVTTIPFTAHVRRTISEMAGRPWRINDDSVEVKFPRWYTGSPDGRLVAFQAAGRIWMTEMAGPTSAAGNNRRAARASRPRRLTSDFEPLENSPAFSPDGRWITFTSWADDKLGHLYKIPVTGGRPQQLTSEPGEYLHPAWSPDGREIVVVLGSGATARRRTVANNLWYKLIRVPANGGDAAFVTTVNRPVYQGRPLMPRRPIVQPSYGPAGRIFFPETKPARQSNRGSVTVLVSIHPDGSDRREHVEFPDADEMTVSPDGRWVGFQEGDNVFLLPFPAFGAGDTAIRVERRRSKLPVVTLTTEGGLFPRWRDRRTLEFGSGARYFAHDVDNGRTDTVTIALRLPRDGAVGTLALTNARIITLENRRVIERGTVVVDGKRIRCVGDCSTAGAGRVVDLSGKTIVPGFIDMHAHHHREHEGVLPRRNWESAVYLAYGMTTTLDNSQWSQNVFPTGEMIAAGVTVGPRTFSTGDPLYAGEGPRQNEIRSYELAEQNVERLASWGAITVKQYQQPNRRQRQWVTDAARRKGLRVTAEGGDLEYNLGMAMDGHTGWEHPLSYAAIYDDAARFFGKAGIVYSATFIVGGATAWNEEYWFQESEVWKDQKQQRWIPWRMLVPHTRRRMLRPVTDYSFPLIAQAMADIIAHGGYGVIGAHGQHHGIGSQWEIWMAASALGPMAALEVASLHAARFLGVERDLGSITAGKLADLVVLNGNPLEDIRKTNDILHVMKDGRLYDGETLNELWPRNRPFGEHYWVDKDALQGDRVRGDQWDANRATSVPRASPKP